MCLIDALDECDEDEIRDMISFFEHLGDLATSKGISFLVCFSSRHYPYISIQNGLSLILENQKEHGQDIVKYVKSELRIGQSYIANQIRAGIPRRSRGIFMWVILVILILNKEYDKGRIYNLQIKYEEIPGDLHELFREILTRNSDEKSRETLRCLQWILFAERPLQPEELYSAVLSDISPAWAHKEILEHDIQRFVLNASLGFADIIASINYTHKTVQFIHESVKDFLLKKDGLREIWVNPNRNIHGHSHEELKQCCLGWIAVGSAICSYESTSEERARINQRNKLPFLDYAIQNVLYHANAAQKYGIDQAGFLKEFEADTWKKIGNRFRKGRNTSNPRLLYTLAAGNMSYLIGCHSSKITFSEVGDEFHGTPLFAAVACRGNEAIIEFLKAQAETTPEFLKLYEQYCRKRFELNYITNSEFDRKNNILFYCSPMNEGCDIIRVALLLNMRRPYLNFNWEDECSQSPLLYVYEAGDKALLGVLIEKCISDFDEIPRFSHALLRTAVERGHGDFIKLLLQKGARIDARNSWGDTALCCAVQGKHKDMAQLLIQAGADIEACGWRRDMTPLLEAVASGQKDLVDLLLEKGANVEAMNKLGRTPLICAIRDDYVNVALQLLEKGSNIEGKDKEGQTPLMWAIRRRNIGSVRLLLSRGAKITAGKVANIRSGWIGVGVSEELSKKIRANSELTLLEFAQQFKETEIIELLSRNGAI